MVKLKRINFLILSVITVACIFASLMAGSVKLNLIDLMTAGENLSKTVFYNLRLPRTILCVEAAVLLSLSGTIFQLYFRNPLAEPGIMGISAGSTLGAVLSFYFGASVSLGAVSGALLSGILVTVLSVKLNRLSASALLLCGTAAGTFYSSLTSIILTTDSKKLGVMYLWMIGSFNGRDWQQVAMVTVMGTVSVFIAIICARKLELLNGGEETAFSLGLNVKLLRAAVITSGSLGTAAAVCAGGTIGFVGLIAPHIARKIFGEKSGVIMVTGAFTGTVLLTLSDILCRTVIAPSELPVGMVTAVLGVPFFISILAAKNR